MTIIKAHFVINVLENERSELLLVKRILETDLGPGLWGFPGGHIDPGELPEAASLRELEEEIGQQQITLLQTIGPIRDSFYGGVYELFLYHYRWHGGQIRLNHEHTSFVWVNREAYRYYSVMDGIDEDIDYFKIWPREYLNPDKLPRR